MSIPSAMSTSWLASDALIAAVEHHQDSSMVISSSTGAGEGTGLGPYWHRIRTATHICVAGAHARPNAGAHAAACVAARAGARTDIYMLCVLYMGAHALPPRSVAPVPAVLLLC